MTATHTAGPASDVPAWPDLADRLLRWYAAQKRALPWRDHPDAYAVWISEIMLQQTRVETVRGYFERWMARFPSVQALAEADPQAVLNAWEGLGYYSRARNAQRAAQQVMAGFGGQLPADEQSLRRLPGIGAYTAAAIASMAFGQDAVALDGNLRRVFSRVFNVDLPERSAQGEARLLALAQAHLPPGRAGDYNQALMDLGATVCTPRNPACDQCPLHTGCQAKALGLQAVRPVRLPRPQTPHYDVAAAVIWRGNEILLAQRPPHGLLGGLWEFPGGKLQAGESPQQALQREIQEELAAGISIGASLGVYKHAFTHFRITLQAFDCRLTEGSQPQALEHSRLAWLPPRALTEYPMGKVDRQIARRIQETHAATAD